MKIITWWIGLSWYTWKWCRYIWPLSEVRREDGCWRGYFDSGCTPREAVLEDLSYG